MRRIYSLSILLLLPFLTFAAGLNNGTISGKVIDSKTGESVPGASVILDGTLLGNNTDLDGFYKIDAVPEGTYTLICRYLSYNTKSINEVKVIAGQNTVINIGLEASSADLQEVVVEATVKRESQTALLLMQKNNASLSDGISSETIRRTPDRSAGDALKRVSGTSMQDNKYVIVRGLSDRYNFAMINSSPLPSSEPDRKTFSFDLFPSAMIDNIQIIKTASPDLPGEFAGGVVQVNTRDIPEENFYQFSEGAGYNSITSLKPYADYKGGKTDFLGIDDGTRALPEAFPASTDFKTSTKQQKAEYSKLLPNDWGSHEQAGAPMNKNYLFAMGQTGRFGNCEIGSIFSLSYNRSQSSIAITRKDFEQDTARLYEYNDEQYKKNLLAGALWNVTLKIGQNNKIRFQNLFNINAEDQTTRRTGDWFESSQYIRSAMMQFQSTQLLNNQITGEHLLPWKGIRVKWNVARNEINKSVPDLRRTYYAKNMIPNDESDTLYTAYIPAVASLNYAGKFFSDLNEIAKSGGFDIAFPIKTAKQKHTLKTGGFLQQRERVFDARVMGVVINDFAKFYMSGNQALLLLPESMIFDTTHFGLDGFRLDEITNGSDHYEAQSNLKAGYIMSDSYFTEKLRSVFGLRLESYNNKLQSMGYSLDSINTDTTFTDLLPSVNLTYSITDKINLRAAASRTVSRPEFRELAPFVYFDFNLFTTINGNPALSRGTIANYDLRAEYYPGSGQLLAITGFYKVFKNPIEQVFAFSGGGSRALTFQNVPGAINYGMELELRKNFDFLSGITKMEGWKNLYFISNLSFIQSKVDLSTILTADSTSRPLQGQSPYLINAGIQYNGEKGFGISVVVNRIGRRIINVGTAGYPDIYENPRTQLDAQISKKFGKNLEAKIGVGDLLHQNVIFYQDLDKDKKFDASKDNSMANWKTGYTVSGGLTFKF